MRILNMCVFDSNVYLYIYYSLWILNFFGTDPDSVRQCLKWKQSKELLNNVRYRYAYFKILSKNSLKPIKFSN
jgi:hypothetical protein